MSYLGTNLSFSKYLLTVHNVCQAVVVVEEYKGETELRSLGLGCLGGSVS